MNQADIEKCAFLYFCGKKDRNILSGKEPMTFEDFERLEYLTDLLGLEKYRAQIWNTFFQQFEEDMEDLEQFYKKNDFDVAVSTGMYSPEIPEAASEGILRLEKWKKEFIEHAPDLQSKKQLKSLL